MVETKNGNLTLTAVLGTTGNDALDTILDEAGVRADDRVWLEEVFQGIPGDTIEEKIANLKPIHETDGIEVIQGVGDDGYVYEYWDDRSSGNASCWMDWGLTPQEMIDMCHGRIVPINEETHDAIDELAMAVAGRKVTNDEFLKLIDTAYAEGDWNIECYVKREHLLDWLKAGLDIE